MKLAHDEFNDKVHKKLRARLVLFFVISVIIFGISVFHIVKDGASVMSSVAGFLVGIIIGIFVSRTYKISWDKNADQAISRFDAIGVLVLILYVIFDIYREQIVEQFVSGPSVVAVSFALLSGIMYGRVLGIRGKIRTVFKEEGIV